MQVYAVFNISNVEEVKKKIEEHYPQKYHQVDDCFFIASQDEMSYEVGEKIGIGSSGDNSISAGIILGVTSYWGRATRELWEWLHLFMKVQ